MRKLLPRHMEIIEEIDKRVIFMPNFFFYALQSLHKLTSCATGLQFRELVVSKHKEMEGKIDSMKVLDNSNPQKPVVRMANLCVVSSHTVNTAILIYNCLCHYEQYEVLGSAVYYIGFAALLFLLKTCNSFKMWKFIDCCHNLNVLQVVPDSPFSTAIFNVLKLIQFFLTGEWSGWVA